MSIEVKAPYEQFFGRNGEPLEAGYIWIGESGLDPIANPVTVYWDEENTITAAQPIRTLAGYPSRDGSPAKIFIDEAYSILVQDKHGALVYSALENGDAELGIQRVLPRAGSFVGNGVDTSFTIRGSYESSLLIDLEIGGAEQAKDRFTVDVAPDGFSTEVIWLGHEGTAPTPFPNETDVVWEAQLRILTNFDVAVNGFDSVATFFGQIDSGYEAENGTIVSAGPVLFQADDSVDITDLRPGWKPFGPASPLHWLDNTDPGVTQMDTAVLNALQYGGEVYIPKDEVILIYGQVIATLTRDTHLVNDGIIIGGTDPTYVDDFIVRMDATSANRYRVTVSGTGTVNGENRVDIPGVASGSGLMIRYSDDVRVTGQNFYAGEDGQDGFGDSGLVLEYCHRVTVDGCFFSGWDDQDIYATGGADPVTASLEGESLIITNNQFRNNGAGSIRVARDYKRVIVSGNTARDVEKLFVCAGGASNFISASELTVTNNLVDGANNVPIDIRYTRAGAGSVVANNQIYDWGFVTQGAAINLRGASNVAVTGNVIRPNTATPNTISCALGVYVTAATGDDGQFYEADNIMISGNVIEVSEGGSRTNNACIQDQTDRATIGDNVLINLPPYKVVSDNSLFWNDPFVTPDKFGWTLDSDATETTTALQLAIDYLVSIGGGVLQLGPYTYQTDAPLDLDDGVTIAGANLEATTVEGTGDYAVIRYFGTIGNQLARATIRDLTVRGPGLANTNANGIQLLWANKPQILNVQFRACFYCVWAAYCIDLTLDHVYCDGAGADQSYGGLFLAGIDETTYGTVDNTQILSNISFRQVSYAGVRAQGTTGLKATNVACLNGDYGWYFGDPNLGSDARILRFLHLTNCFADTNVFAGFKFSQGGATLPIRDVKLVNGWAGSISDTTGKAIEIDGMQYSTFDGGVFTYARSNLIHVQNSDHLVFSGNELYQHDWGNTGDDCVLIQNSELITISNATAQPQTGGAGTAGVRFEGCTECAVTGGAFDDVVGVELHNSTRCSVTGVTVQGANALAIESGTSNFNTIVGNTSAVAPTIIGANTFEAGNAGTTNPRLRIVGGSAAAPALYLSTAANSGWYRSGTHAISYSANGTRRLEISDTRYLVDTSLLGNYADDTAAAAGGVAIGQLYRTTSTIKVRVT